MTSTTTPADVWNVQLDLADVGTFASFTDNAWNGFDAVDRSSDTPHLLRITREDPEGSYISIFVLTTNGVLLRSATVNSTSDATVVALALALLAEVSS